MDAWQHYLACVAVLCFFFFFLLIIGAHNVGPGKAVQPMRPDKTASILWRWVGEALAVCVDRVVKVWKGEKWTGRVPRPCCILVQLLASP